MSGEVDIVDGEHERFAHAEAVVVDEAEEGLRGATRSPPRSVSIPLGSNIWGGHECLNRSFYL
jgi:hypothetical protein